MFQNKAQIAGDISKTLLASKALQIGLDGAPAIRDFAFRARDVRCVYLFYLPFARPLFENPGLHPKLK